MPTYSATTDLLTGNVPVPSYLSPEKFVQDATDEIDSKLGFIYSTPFDVAENGPLARPVRLLLKRINNFLASGRLLLAADSAGEDDRVHAYGWSLIQEANEALAQIIDKKILLEGATPIDNGDGPVVSSVIVLNEDPESHVAAFYDRIANPNYSYFGLGRYAESERGSFG